MKVTSVVVSEYLVPVPCATMATRDKHVRRRWWGVNIHAGQSSCAYAKVMFGQSSESIQQCFLGGDSEAARGVGSKKGTDKALGCGEGTSA
jgi:hypothetical protein